MTKDGQKQITDLMDSELAELLDQALKDGTARAFVCNMDDSHWDDYEEQEHDCGEDTCVCVPEDQT